jgi:hypothetical protein
LAVSKIVDEEEAVAWIMDGRPYVWMVEEYRRKYGVETSVGMWAQFRRRRGLPRRIVMDPALIPWRVKDEHHGSHTVHMLRAEARARAGKALAPVEQGRLASFRRMLADGDLVVHYEPDSEEGWFLVPREPGDTDIIRHPGEVQRYIMPSEQG